MTPLFFALWYEDIIITIRSKIMDKENHVSAARVNTGEQDGIKVYAVPENGVYIVESPNFYDCYWKLTGKMKDKDEVLGVKLKPEDITSFFNPEVMDGLVKDGTITPDQKENWGMLNLIKKDENGKVQFKEERSVHIMVNVEKLSTPEEITSFNFAINHARSVNQERQQDMARFKFKNGRDGEPTDQIQALAPDNAYEIGSRRLKVSLGKPEKNWVGGEVLEAGKFYTFVHTGNSERDDPEEGKIVTVHIHAVNTADLLKGNDWLLQNREKAVRELCPEGEFKSFNWSQNSKIRVSDYNPEKSQENKLKKEQERIKYAATAEPSSVKVPFEIAAKKDEATQQKVEEQKPEPVQEEKKKAPGKAKGKAKEAEMAR
ncbi:MAG: hypothetical protein C0490_00760 [Marivirga sp.]|nr:hypothetical protein [Marivirga sp.]